MTGTTRGMMTAGALVIVASIAAATIADAQPRRGRVRDGLPGPRAEMRQQMGDELNLSEAQKEKLAAIHEDTRQQQILRHGKMADLQAQIRVEFMNDNPDKDKIRALHREISALRAAAADARLEARLATRDVFTPEQREQMKQMRGDGPRCGKHFQRGGMRGHRGSWGQGRGAGMHCQPGCCMGQGFGSGPGPWWMDDDDAPAPPAPPDDEE